MRTKGFQRSLKVLRASGPDKTLPPVSLAFKWAGYLDGALTAVDGAIRDLRMGARLRRRGLRRGR
ncbi:MAG TPA: hypothetical protein VEQ10_18860 [Vicinamibacteria bacterium]|nr:hypothetical protein [Vicinamibacteria bacterium]